MPSMTSYKTSHRWSQHAFAFLLAGISKLELVAQVKQKLESNEQHLLKTFCLKAPKDLWIRKLDRIRDFQASSGMVVS